MWYNLNTHKKEGEIGNTKLSDELFTFLNISVLCCLLDNICNTTGPTVSLEPGKTRSLNNLSTYFRVTSTKMSSCCRWVNPFMNQSTEGPRLGVSVHRDNQSHKVLNASSRLLSESFFSKIHLTAFGMASTLISCSTIDMVGCRTMCGSEMAL